MRVHVLVSYMLPECTYILAGIGTTPACAYVNVSLDETSIEKCIFTTTLDYEPYLGNLPHPDH